MSAMEEILVIHAEDIAMELDDALGKLALDHPARPHVREAFGMVGTMLSDLGYGRNRVRPRTAPHPVSMAGVTRVPTTGLPVHGPYVQALGAPSEPRS